MNFDFTLKMDKMLGDIKGIGKPRQNRGKKIVSFSMSP
jgi:hypothetical protein